MQEPVEQNDALAVSIVIPARNEEENVGALLESLAALNFPREKLEIILVNHESTDRTGDIARAYGAKVVMKKGGTISSARNLGVSHVCICSRKPAALRRLDACARGTV